MTTESAKFFFSYAREDSELVLRLARELRRAGANVWLDQLDIRGGSRWDEAVQAALESCRGLVAILSPSSVASQNFLDEVSYALEEQKQVIPVLSQQCKIPFRLRRVQYVNFVASYEEGFAELLRAMGLERATETAGLPVMAPSNGVMQPAIHKDTLGDMAPASEETKRKAELKTQETNMATEQLHPRMTGAFVGAVGGAVIGTLTFLMLGSAVDRRDWWIGALALGAPWAIAGAITGTNWRLIRIAFAAALVGAATCLCLLGKFGSASDDFIGAIITGGFFGALLGAVAGVALKRLKIWS